LKSLLRELTLYEINEITQGGNAIVYKVKRKSDGREFALKEQFNLPKEKKQRFQNEIQTVIKEQESCSGILPICEHSADDNNGFWYTMPIAQPIKDALCNKPLTDIINAIIEIAKTLKYLHNKQISHRDIKPDNIFNFDGHFRLGDFGLVNYPESGNLTKTESHLVAWPTMAPEMRRKPNAGVVRKIFNKHLELKSVPDLISYLKEHDIKTTANKPFTKGPLYHLLQNRVYVGLITHKENCYKGEHQAIIDNEVFDKVQALLAENRVKYKCREKSKNPSLLAGKLFDDKGNYMSPSHSNKKGKRYRYYLSQAMSQFRKQDAGSVSKISAGEIEDFVIQEVSDFVFSREEIHQYMKDFDVTKQKDILDSLKNIKLNLKGSLSSHFIRTIISKTILSKDNVEIILCKKQLIKALEAIAYGTSLPEEIKKETTVPIILSKEIQLQQTANKGSWIIVSNSQKPETNINLKLLKAITKSFYWNNILLSGDVRSSLDIQKLEGLNDNSYIKDVLFLRFLAPDIVQKIIEGTQPVNWSVQKLFGIKTLDWNKQRKILAL
jgi:serine/threonine protein kinase